MEDLLDFLPCILLIGLEFGLQDHHMVVQYVKEGNLRSCDEIMMEVGLLWLTLAVTTRLECAAASPGAGCCVNLGLRQERHCDGSIWCKGGHPGLNLYYF